MNVITTGDGPGNVAVYTKAKGSPKIYAGGPLQPVYFRAYDGSTGTLVVDGENSSYAAAFASLVRWKVYIDHPERCAIGFPGGLAWAAKNDSMNVEDQDNGGIYRFKVNGKVTGTTTLNSAGDTLHTRSSAERCWRPPRRESVCTRIRPDAIPSALSRSASQAASLSARRLRNDAAAPA
jgi:hypothetical protein